MNSVEAPEDRGCRYCDATSGQWCEEDCSNPARVLSPFVDGLEADDLMDDEQADDLTNDEQQTAQEWHNATLEWLDDRQETARQVQPIEDWTYAAFRGLLPPLVPDAVVEHIAACDPATMLRLYALLRHQASPTSTGLDDDSYAGDQCDEFLARVQEQADGHLPAGHGDCTCGYPAWSVAHVLGVAIREGGRA